MKLRNKKTGETINVVVNSTDFNTIRLSRVNIVKSLQEVNTWEYNTLAELNEEWEDYEAPKAHWYIYGAEPFEIDEDNWDKDFVEELKSIGNYFETKEDAEKAVEKLKAWKRLKDMGFMFKGLKNDLIDWSFNKTYGTLEEAEKCLSDFCLLFRVFRGEE